MSIGRPAKRRSLEDAPERRETEQPWPMYSIGRRGSRTAAGIVRVKHAQAVSRPTSRSNAAKVS
jgi:hypothetical protein